MNKLTLLIYNSSTLHSTYRCKLAGFGYTYFKTAIQLFWLCLLVEALRIPTLSVQNKKICSHVICADSFSFAMAVADPEGAPGTPPKRVLILTFWHTNFMKRSRIMSWRPLRETLDPPLNGEEVVKIIRYDISLRHIAVFKLNLNRRLCPQKGPYFKRHCG